MVDIFEPSLQFIEGVELKEFKGIEHAGLIYN